MLPLKLLYGLHILGGFLSSVEDADCLWSLLDPDVENLWIHTNILLLIISVVQVSVDSEVELGPEFILASDILAAVEADVLIIQGRNLELNGPEAVADSFRMETFEVLGDSEALLTHFKTDQEADHVAVLVIFSVLVTSHEVQERSGGGVLNGQSVRNLASNLGGEVVSEVPSSQVRLLVARYPLLFHGEVLRSLTINY